MKRLSLLLGTLVLGVNSGVAGNWVPPAAGATADVMHQLDRAHWIASGAKSSPDAKASADLKVSANSKPSAGSTTPGRVVYVFTDPNCPYCNELWKALSTIHAPGVQIRYLLVAVIDADSRGKDAAILESTDPAATLDKHERTFAGGGVAPKSASRAGTNEAISTNEGLMAALHIYATPGLAYLDEHNEMKVFAGMPNPEQLQMILGSRLRQ